MRWTKWTLLLLGAVLFALMPLGCEGCGEDEGPAEELGEDVDETVEEAGDEIEEATD